MTTITICRSITENYAIIDGCRLHRNLTPASADRLMLWVYKHALSFVLTEIGWVADCRRETTS